MQWSVFPWLGLLITGLQQGAVMGLGRSLGLAFSIGSMQPLLEFTG